MPEPTPLEANRAERTLAFMIAGIIGLSILCIVITIVATLVIGASDLHTGIWPAIAFLPEIGLPVGLLLLIALLVLSLRRRSRAARDARAAGGSARDARR